MALQVCTAFLRSSPVCIPHPSLEQVWGGSKHQPCGLQAELEPCPCLEGPVPPSSKFQGFQVRLWICRILRCFPLPPRQLLSGESLWTPTWAPTPPLSPRPPEPSVAGGRYCAARELGEMFEE